MNSTLHEVQISVNHQIHRDLSDKSSEDLKNMFFFGLGEETGEVLGIAKRLIRGYDKDIVSASREHLIEELGDVLWYLTAVCKACDTSLQEIWDYNVIKLEERYGK